MVKYQSYKKQGFTLIEIIVALAIFTVVAVVAIGALAKVISANKKAQSIQAAISNLSYAIESMSRELRLGRNYLCVSNFSTIPASQNTLTPNACNATNNGNYYLAFESSRTYTDVSGNFLCNAIIVYRFTDLGSGKYSLDRGMKKDCNTAMNENTDLVPVISSNVTLTGYTVRVVSNGTHPYPFVTFRLSGYSGTRDKDKTYFDIQTTASQNI